MGIVEKDKRLEELSDLVRKGIPISFTEALEVIDYQGKLKENSPKNKFKRFWKRKK